MIFHVSVSHELGNQTKLSDVEKLPMIFVTILSAWHEMLKNQFILLAKNS